jgi:Na+/proline symporter
MGIRPKLGISPSSFENNFASRIGPPCLLKLEPAVSFSDMNKAGWLKAIIAGALLWVAMSLAAIAHEPAHAGSVVGTIEVVLSLVVVVIACLLLRW